MRGESRSRFILLPCAARHCTGSSTTSQLPSWASLISSVSWAQPPFVRLAKAARAASRG